MEKILYFFFTIGLGPQVTYHTVCENLYIHLNNISSLYEFPIIKSNEQHAQKGRRKIYLCLFENQWLHSHRTQKNEEQMQHERDIYGIKNRSPEDFKGKTFIFIAVC